MHSVARLLSMLSRDELEAFVQLGIDLLDTIDGDPDREGEEDRCSAGDDGCAPMYTWGRKRWGSEHDDPAA